MREIKFRGKRIDDNEWVQGDLITETDANLVVIRTFIHLRLSQIDFTGNSLASKICLHEIDPKSKGQYTGLTDRNGKEIYESDIVRKVQIGFTDKKDIEDFDTWLEDEKVISHEIEDDGFITYYYPSAVDIVVMDRFPCYWLKNESFGYEGEDLVSPSDCEVIGNIYENPEMLEVS